MRALRRCAAWFTLAFVAATSSATLAAETGEPIRVGSKNFNENYILAEIVAQLLESRGFAVTRQFGLGGTLICYDALLNDEIDVYPEYTGTLSSAILKREDRPDRAELNGLIASEGLTLGLPFGFNNTYAVTMRAAHADALGVASIGDLAGVLDLQVALSHEFLERADGWPGLKVAYGLDHDVTGIEHALAYQAMDDGAIDVTDAYSTDGELERYGLRVLADDRGYFPNYFAAPLARVDLDVAARTILAELADSIDDARMQEMNAEVVFAGRTFADVARDFLVRQGMVEGGAAAAAGGGMWSALVRNTLRHLQLTGIALVLAIIVGVGLSLAIYRRPRVSAGVMYVCGLMQTIPSIALLALMIPLFGIGMVPAIVALFLYSLLPILRNAVSALTNVDPTLVRVAEALGLSEREQLKHLRVPLSLPAIFAGVRTAAVISIGTATLAAFIGAGGLGDPIVTGLSLNSPDLILQGAIPAALLAIVTELTFGALEARMTRRF